MRHDPGGVGRLSKNFSGIMTASSEE